MSHCPRAGRHGTIPVMTRLRHRWPLVLTAACVLALPLPALADDDRDVRKVARCTAGSKATLRLRPDDGRIRVELEVESDRPRSRWTVIVLHERRTVARTALRADEEGTLRLRRTVPDWFGPDSFAARAAGPRAEACRVSTVV